MMYDNAIFLAVVGFITGMYFASRTDSIRNRMLLAITIFSFLMAARGIVLYLFFNSIPSEQFRTPLRALDYILTAPLVPLGLEMVRANIAARVDTVDSRLLELARGVPPILLTVNAGLVFLMGVQGSRLVAMLLWLPTISFVMVIFLLSIVRNPFKMSKPEFSRGSRLIFVGYILFYIGEGVFAGVFRMINIAFAVIAGGVFVVAAGGIVLSTITFAGIYSRMKTGYILVLNNYEIDSTNIGGKAESGRPATMGTRLARAVVSLLKESLEKVFSEGEEIIIPYKEIPFLQRDKLYQINILPHQLDSKGGVFSALIIIDDVTSSIREKKLEELADLLDKVSEERDKAELYFNVLSHDICNLMQGISLGVELALESDSKEERFLIQSHHQIERAKDLLKDIQLMADVQQVQPEIGALELFKVIQNAIAEAESRYQQVQFDISAKQIGEKIFVLAGSRMKRVFVEILEFALKKKSQKDVKLEVTIEAIKNDTSVTIEMSFPQLKVSNPSILGDFVQGPQNRLAGGGLGLPLAKAVVESYGGSLETEGVNKDRGVSFFITLPQGERTYCGGYQNTESRV